MDALYQLSYIGKKGTISGTEKNKVEGGVSSPKAPLKAIFETR
jgi:hypothetical protein